jgi:hypothetical protein
MVPPPLFAISLPMTIPIVLAAQDAAAWLNGSSPRFVQFAPWF